MDNPLISVIVPVYKVEPYLDKCVQSIVDQTYQNLEIILVDDGSPDRCPEMCDAWAKQDPRIKVIHKPNGGLSDARNAGMKAANGEFIGFVDSDDWIAPEMYERLVESIKHDGSDIAACDVFIANDDIQATIHEATSFKKTVLLDKSEAMNQLIHGYGIRATVWNKIYKRRVIGKIIFPIGKLHEDEFVTYQIIDRAKSVSYVDMPMYYYRQRNGSIMTTYSAKHVDAIEAGLYRLRLLKSKYPSLYNHDIITFCISCISLYSSYHDGEKESMLARRRIIEYRKAAPISCNPILKLGFKDALYVFGSTPMLIDISSRLWKHLQKENECNDHC